MSATLSFTVTSAWTEIASGSADVAVQRRTGSQVIVHVAAAEPAAIVESGILLWSDLPAISLTNLSASDKVFARTLEGTARLDVIRS